MKDEPAVRQSSLALMGDMIKSSPEFVAPAIPTLLPLVVENLSQREHRKVCSNAAWAFGELITTMGDMVVSQQVEPALTRLVTILNSEDVHPNVMVNVTITLGKLGRISTDRVAPTFHTFAETMCLAVAEISDTYEKNLAFEGLCMIAQRNPQPLMESAHQFVVAVVSWAELEPNEPPQQLKDMLQAILTVHERYPALACPVIPTITTANTITTTFRLRLTPTTLSPRPATVTFLGVSPADDRFRHHSHRLLQPALRTAPLRLPRPKLHHSVRSSSDDAKGGRISI